MSKSMADSLKKKLSTKNFTAMLVFGAIIVVFVFFGFGGPGKSGMGVGSVARVNNSLISVADLAQEQQRLEQYYSSLFGGGMDFGNRRQEMQQQAIQQLVRGELIFQAARKSGIQVTDAEVRDYIVKEVPFFQENGRFSREMYNRYIEFSRTSPGEFERKIRKEVVNLRLRRLFEAGLAPSQMEIEKLAELKNTKLNIQFAKFNRDEFVKTAKFTPAEEDAALADAALAEKIKTYFETHKAEFAQKEEIHAQHILIAFKAGEADGEKVALAKITEIQRRLASEDFGKVASQVSEDPGSKAKNGDLGFFPRGRMVPEFEKVAFASQVGKVSEPVKTNYGYHLIKVLEKKEAKDADFETNKRVVAGRVLAEDKFDKTLAELEKGLADGGNVDAQITALGGNWQETGSFDLSQEGAPQLNSPSVAAALKEISPKEPVLKRVIREGSDRYVLKMKDFSRSTAAATASGAPVAAPAVKGDTDAVRRQRAYSTFEEWLNQYRAKSDVYINQQVVNQ